MVKGAASQVLQVPPLKSGVYLGYSVCFDVYSLLNNVIINIPTTNLKCYIFPCDLFYPHTLNVSHLNIKR